MNIIKVTKDTEVLSWEQGTILLSLENDLNLKVEYNAFSVWHPFERSTGFGGFYECESVNLIDIELTDENEELVSDYKFNKTEIEDFILNRINETNTGEDYV
jgi:hypothetical protein